MTTQTTLTASAPSAAGAHDALRVGVYVCHCGLNIAQSVDCDGIAARAAGLSDVTVAKGIGYACSEPGQREIRDDIAEYGLNRVVVASCSPRLHEPTFRQMLKEAGLNPYLLEMANLREQCSWVHMHDRQAATAKAWDLVKMAVARARRLARGLALAVWRPTLIAAVAVALLGMILG